MGTKQGAIPTVSQIGRDQITKIAALYWLPSTEPHEKYDPKIIADIYQYELLKSKFDIQRVMLLEFSQYLEAYLWPNYNSDTSSLEHVLSIIVMANEKFRERVPALEAFTSAPSQFPGFFKRVMESVVDCDDISYRERTEVVLFLVHCFNSLEVDLIRTQIQKLVAMPIWINLLPERRNELIGRYPELRKVWKFIEKRDTKLSAEELKDAQNERTFLARLLKFFLEVVENIPNKGEIDDGPVRYCETVVQLLIDLEASLPTRRFFNSLLDNMQVYTRCTMSSLVKRPEGRLFGQLLEMLKFYLYFEIDEISGEPLTESEVHSRHYAKMMSLQKAVFINYPEDLKEFCMLNVTSIDTGSFLRKHFSQLTREELYSVAASLYLVPTGECESHPEYSSELLVELLVHRHERRLGQLAILNEMPLYPTEEVIWDENLVPNDYFFGQRCLALNKLNLQFLTLYDYLLRNFNLFRLESTYEIRQDIEDTLFRMKPWKHESGKDVVFGGWARMALPITSFLIVEVSKPNIGERSPACVRADVTITLGQRSDVRTEWEGLRKHDVCFLITANPANSVGTRYNIQKPFKEQIQVAYVRGCEIEGMVGPDGRVIDDHPNDQKPVIPGSARTYRVWLDTSQYRIDMEKHVVGGEQDVYETFNVFMRRKPKENNFKAVLETMRNLMNTKFVVPEWLHDILLGYGDPDSAHYSKMPKIFDKLDFNDTFLELQHVRDSFPGCKLICNTEEDKLKPPFRVTFKDSEHETGKDTADDSAAAQKELLIESYTIPRRSPFPALEPKRNAVRFTPVQVEAIKAGMQPGLTMVVGPPGTGKTDVAVQIISNIYHNWPEQRTLIITHSNQALNQLFEKIMHLDIDERHLLRLGHGEEALETEKDFSRYGRVNYVLSKRLELLNEVERLQHCIGVTGDVAYTCETAGYFFLYQIRPRWEEYLQKIQPKGDVQPDVDSVARLFPFSLFFAQAPQPLFKETSYEEDLEVARSCWRHISHMFQELDEFRAFELLRTGRDRTDYLLVKEAKIIAMTCTHAALCRKDLVRLGFRYDNVLMEEAAQILEVETFIPLLLQEPQDGRNRLKRWIMIGDHHQLSPVIKNAAIQKYSNMEQSLFRRFVTLGVPTVDLDMQGRARPSLATLYNWRYKRLGNLAHVEKLDAFCQANAGFAYDFQLIDVGDLNGVGESTPSPYFYQNLAEAEYAVALFMYMRVLGYPAESISILTTYNGQKHLLRDVLRQRCSNNPIFGLPRKVTTVDKYQGQQNEYIILSLVRTKAVGHIRDIRRLVVALSRARLGLYILARVSLFRNCFELTPAFNTLCRRPQKLLLVPNETWPTERELNNHGAADDQVEIHDMTHMARFVHEFYQANSETLMNAWLKAQGYSRDHISQDAAVEPYENGKVDGEHAVDIEQARKEEGARVETDIEFEILDEQKSADDKS